MIISDYSIPDNFVRLDTNINSADSFANVRDIVTIRKNHNKLLAERAKHCILSYVGLGIDTGSSGNGWAGTDFYFGYGADPTLGDVFFNAPIKISDQTQTVSIKMYARENSAGTIACYPMIYRFGTIPQLIAAHSFTVSGSSEALYEETITVPLMSPEERDMCMFALFVHGGMAAISGKGTSGTTIRAAGSNWIDAAFVFEAQVSTTFICDSGGTAIPGIEPNLCIEVQDMSATYGAGYYRAYHLNDWNIIPTAGTHYCDQYYSRKLAITTLCLYEDPVSSFSQGTLTGVF